MRNRKSKTHNNQKYIIMNTKVLSQFAELKSIPAPHFEDEKPYNHDCWVSKIDSSYICNDSDTKHLEYLIKKGITDLQNTSGISGHTANIGFNPKEQKWYGWSHRAIFGFGIGSECKKGHCAFMASNEEEFKESCLSFWVDEYTSGDEKAEIITRTDEDWVSQKGVLVSYTYNDRVPNKRLRGTVYENFSPFPKTWGKGEWVAKTLEDAKEMAIDFANGVS
jgi:hypothetical protein